MPNECIDVIERICRLPVDFRAAWTKSPAQLLEESGLAQRPACLTTTAVESYLREHVDLIEAWRGWSDDKRVPEGWYFQGLVVGYYPNGPRETFTDPFQACASFVVREIQDMLLQPSS